MSLNSMKSNYIAHKRNSDGEEQSVKEHCEATARLCHDFAIEQLKPVLYETGQLHDIGKYQRSFQCRINGENIAIEHSICGAVEAESFHNNPVGLLMAYCISGHHCGIPDGGSKNDSSDMPTLYGRLSRTPEDYGIYKTELRLPDINDKKVCSFLAKGCTTPDEIVDQFSFWVRYAFSCLVDADSIDTAQFCNKGLPDNLHGDFQKALDLVNKRLSEFTCTTDLQKSRSAIQQQVFDKVSVDSEIYLMNMPTGSGKTLCSVKFALERCLRTGRKRIIYVIPYNSIIDQTACEFEETFGEAVDILRHQSTFSYEDDEDTEENYKFAVKNATENWDASFIITTAVQFFESIYSNRRGKLRKMHNMGDSVIVLDEAHLMPVDYLQPCIQAISYITKFLNSEALFLTATMPDFEKLIKKYALSCNIEELVEDKTLFSKFKKCSFRYIGEVSQDSLLEEAEINPSALIVVNSKRTARELYSKAVGEKYHLSTYMTAYDRQKVIKKIKERLKLLEDEFGDKECVPPERRILVISASLIEAGVDLDFYRVYRELNRLDSLLQAGGRCNREGKRQNAQTCIFELKEDSSRSKQDKPINLTRGLIKKYDDISSEECIKEYYDRMYMMADDEIQSHSMHNKCKRLENIPFREYAEEFKMIEDTYSVVVPRNEESRKIVNEIRIIHKGNARKLQKYTCSLSKWEFDDLCNNQHVINDYDSGIWCLENPDYYDEETGITFEPKDYFI